MYRRKEYCCIDMDNAVLKGIVHYANVVHGEPEYDSYYIEVVKSRKKKNRIIYNIEEIVTEDVILIYCPFCSREL